MTTTPPPPAPPASSPPVPGTVMGPAGPRPAIPVGRTGARFLDDVPAGTARFLRIWMVILPLLIVVTATLAVTGGFLVQDAARSTSRSTAPSLVEVQDLFASVAEANAGAASAHLSIDVAGEEDRASRNLYLGALTRSNQQLAQVTADFGASDAAQQDVQTIATALTTYNGRVESARLAKLNGLAEADDRLRSALDIVDTEVAPAVAELNDLGRSQFDQEADSGAIIIVAALIAGGVALVTMIWMQVRLARRLRRILNPLLVLSTVALAVMVGLLAQGHLARRILLDDAKVGGFDSIAASSEAQAAVFEVQSELGLVLLDRSGAAERTTSIEELVLVADERIDEVKRRADSEREQAAADALAVRWARYAEVVTDIVAFRTVGADQDAVELFQGDGLSTFNGVNTAIESVLSDNRTQFADGVEAAESSVEWLPWICIGLSVIAGMLAIVGLQRRLGDYR